MTMMMVMMINFLTRNGPDSDSLSRHPQVVLKLFELHQAVLVAAVKKVGGTPYLDGAATLRLLLQSLYFSVLMIFGASPGDCLMCDL